MRSVGIVCEYDPFHNGHRRQIEIVKKNDPNAAVVCLMSGNLTQRGRFAIADKYTRASAAIASGADIVLELPYPYSSASAEYFAAAGVFILDSLGTCEMSFGSECGDIELLSEVAKVTANESFLACYRNIFDKKPDIGSATAYAEAYRELTGKNLPTTPNDILGVSYIRAAIKTGTTMKLTAIKREGAGFSDDTVKENEYPSATAIRKLFSSGEYEKGYEYMPIGASEIYREAYKEGLFPTAPEKISTAAVAFFRLKEPEYLDSIAEASGGVGRRLSAAAKESTDFEAMIALASTKRYTDARLRRVAIYCLTGVTEDDIKEPPKYTTLLAANKRGREFLASRDKDGIAVVTKPADAPICRQTELSRKLDSIFTLCLPKSREAEAFLRSSPKILEKD